MKNIACTLFLGLAIAGCGSGSNGMHTPDMSMTTEVDMSMPDMSQKTCGAIVLCAIQSGTANPTGLTACAQGASTAAFTQAGAIVLCAVQNMCVSFGGDAGVSTGGGNTQLFQCLQMHCATQLAGCMGLGL
jgi:hypothetical protein